MKKIKQLFAAIAVTFSMMTPVVADEVLVLIHESPAVGQIYIAPWSLEVNLDDSIEFTVVIRNMPNTTVDLRFHKKIHLETCKYGEGTMWIKAEGQKYWDHATDYIQLKSNSPYNTFNIVAASMCETYERMMQLASN